MACQPAPKKDTTNTIFTREKNDAVTLNLIAASDQLSAYAGMQIFQTLTKIDFKTEKTVGVLATAPAEISYDSSEKMLATYTIWENASFANSDKVTFEDIQFSIKLNLCPLVSNSDGENYYGFIEKITAKNQQSFTCLC